MIEVLSAGLYSSFQDMGRFGHRRYGVPLSGAMDRYSATIANYLVGNDRTAAVLEITLTGPVLKFHSEVHIAISGAGFSPTLNNREIPLNTRIKIPEDSILKFGLAYYGLRAYLAVSGGFDVPLVMNSHSYYLGITSDMMIRKGQQYGLLKNSVASTPSASVKEPMDHFSSEIIEIKEGPEYAQLSAEQKKVLFETSFTVNNESNRMAYILDHAETLSSEEIITSPTQPGTVQLTPGGKLIVLMRDAQTTGGYARILQLTESAINRLAQKRSGDRIQFKLI